MQSTYKGRTAGGILRTATVQQMRSGNYEVVVTTPDGREVVASLGERRDGFGGTIRDVLVLTHVEGCIARIQASGAAVSKLRALERKADASYPA